MIPICLYEKKFKGISLKKSLTEFLNSEIFLKNLKRKILETIAGKYLNQC